VSGVARVCPYCRALVSRGEPRCDRCGRRQPGPVSRFASELAATAGAEGAPVTALLLLVNFAVFAATYITPHAAGGPWEQAGRALGGATPARLVASGAIYLPFTLQEPWRVVSAGFVHIGFLHLVMNMVGLVAVDLGAERLVGSARFLVAYFVTGAVGFAASWWWASPTLLTAGASASLFGLLGLMLGWRWARRDPAWRHFATYTVLSALAFGFIPGLRVNNAAHIGGLLAGLAAGVGYAREPRPYRQDRLFAGLAVATAVVMAASLVLARTSPVTRLLVALEAEQRAASVLDAVGE